MPANPSLPPQPGTLSQPPRWSGVVLWLFVMALFLAALRLFVPSWSNSAWPDAILLIFGVAASVASLARQLPTPNVILAGVVAAVLGGLAHAVNDVTGWPFGRFEFNAPIGPRIVNLLPVAMLAIWVMTALTSRGAARRLLHRSRSHPLHGYRVIGLATVLMTLFAMTLMPFGASARDWWTATPTPILNWAGWGSVGLLIQVAITPLLIDKFPGPRPPNLWPLMVWGLTTAFLALGLLVRLP